MMAKFDVWYMRPSFFCEGILGIVPVDLSKTHEYLKTVEAKSLEEVYSMMQGEIWSPNGEARELILSKGLEHTSMSIGDVAVDENGTVWVCHTFGFKETQMRVPTRREAVSC
jgi:hypothetical protein